MSVIGARTAALGARNTHIMSYGGCYITYFYRRMDYSGFIPFPMKINGADAYE